MSPFDVDLSSLQPSQLYISTEKLEAVRKALAEGRRVEPVPVKSLDGRWVLTDGHTRALAAWMRGDRTISAVWEADELDWDAYRITVDWCLRDGVRSVADLERRVVSQADCAKLWLERCRRMHEDLAVRRALREV